MTRNIVIKAIDLWCKPDTPEDNFEEDASGWGSGDEVLVFLTAKSSMIDTYLQ